ncbi:MAG: amino acid--tRNA ligase-related protein [Spirochaetia bacterium]|jgi:lysyl-tRNA synthetase class 2
MENSLRDSVLGHARFIARLKGFFAERGYAEVETPTLSPYLIPEPAIEVFRTDFLSRSGATVPLWLIPSPELWMKRLLARGSGDIFQVSRSFRNGDFGGAFHNPEFRLLEWYTMNAGYRESIPIAEELFAFLLASGEHLGGRREALAPPFLRYTMEEAFRVFAGIELAACLEIDAMREAGISKGLAMPVGLTWEEAFHIVFLTLVEPAIPREHPVVLMDYPRQIPTTARLLPGTPWSERWELYVDGVEIANCYTEETDPGALEVLLNEESERKKACSVQHRIDRELAGLFGPGFPLCSGAAMGIDRLEMVFRGEKSLEGVILFPFSAILGS